MTFDEAMKQIQAKGSENQTLEQAIFRNHCSRGIYDSINFYLRDSDIVLTAEQFLKIYEALGE